MAFAANAKNTPTIARKSEDLATEFQKVSFISLNWSTELVQ